MNSIRLGWATVLVALALVLVLASAARANDRADGGWMWTMDRALGTLSTGPAIDLDRSDLAVEPMQSAGDLATLDVVSPAAGDGPFEFLYTLADPSSITLEVLDSTGERVDLIEDGFESAGEHLATWDPDDSDVPAGVYLIVLTAGDDRVVTHVVRTE